VRETAFYPFPHGFTMSEKKEEKKEKERKKVPKCR
jgi:hypothetical protein